MSGFVEETKTETAVNDLIARLKGQGKLPTTGDGLERFERVFEEVSANILNKVRQEVPRAEGKEATIEGGVEEAKGEGAKGEGAKGEGAGGEGAGGEARGGRRKVSLRKRKRKNKSMRRQSRR